MHRWVDIAEVPLIGWNLPIRVQVPTAQHQAELLLGETWIDKDKRACVKGEIPGRVPRIFPFVWHGDDITVAHVMPLLIPKTRFLMGTQGINAPLLQPGRNVIVVELFGPQHPSHRLPEHQLLLSAKSSWHHPGVKVIALLLSAIQDLIEIVIGRVILCFRR